MPRHETPRESLSTSEQDVGADAIAGLGSSPGPDADGDAKHSRSDAQATASPSLWRHVRRDVVLLGAGSTGIVIAQLCFRSILIVALAPTAYGRLSLILSVYNTIFIIGASGLPNSVARYISVSSRAEDLAIVRSAIWAGAWPTAIAAVIVATISAMLLRSPLAFVFAAIGLSSLVYSLLTTGILRGRGRIVLAASVLPIAAIGEVAPLAVLWLSGLGVTPLSAFGVFCLGNLIGLIAGILCVVRTSPRAADASPSTENGLGSVPSSRELLGFSLWLAAATIAVAIMPLIMRSIAVIDSYAVVAVIDVALVLLSIPQRVGAVIVQAVIPHATRALRTGNVHLTISRREHVVLIAPFVLIAAVIALTPIVGWAFTLLGRPGYAKSAPYLALALLAAPPRILYGLVQGILVAHGEGRFLAHNAWVITTVAAVAMLAATVLGSTLLAFAMFVIACWAIYLNGLRRIHRMATTGAPSAYPIAMGLSPSIPNN
jgi:O-antigen/teichoic acid export membrane protein